jgi:urocanate hydratase
MGGAQPLGGDHERRRGDRGGVDPSRIQRSLDTGYVDVVAKDLADAVAMAKETLAEKKPLSIAVLGNASETHPELLKMGIVPDVVTDQTSAHDARTGMCQAA